MFGAIKFSTIFLINWIENIDVSDFLKVISFAIKRYERKISDCELS